MWPKSHRRNPPSRRDVAALAATAGASPAPSGRPHPTPPGYLQWYPPPGHDIRNDPQRPLPRARRYRWLYPHLVTHSKRAVFETLNLRKVDVKRVSKYFFNHMKQRFYCSHVANPDFKTSVNIINSEDSQFMINNILIIGYGHSENSIRPEIVKYCRSKRLAVEILTTEDACSTFNFLNSEKRNVAAAILPEREPKLYETKEFASRHDEIKQLEREFRREMFDDHQKSTSQDSEPDPDRKAIDDGKKS
ncbi:NADH dehydrogenase [ubiquinone] 1 alpha subcomplex assembly factor 3 [Nymphon striatum]|nr:NADH dehydrogenase [ubiquinone] 1 alpha subcomplex assembly factor 3 [Nymphon striatum]